MPKMVLTAQYVSVGGNDLSGHASKGELVVDVDDKEVTTFASQGFKEYLGGLAGGTLSVTFKQDYAANEVDSLMWPLLLGRVPVPFELRPTQATASASNPAYSGNVLIKQWKPLAGSVGDVAEVDVSWPTSGVIDRATS